MDADPRVPESSGAAPLRGAGKGPTGGPGAGTPGGPGPGPSRGPGAAPRHRRRGAYWLLLLPFLALLYPPLYSHASPHVWGIPFFYWYQAVWLVLTAGITTIVFRLTR